MNFYNNILKIITFFSCIIITYYIINAPFGMHIFTEKGGVVLSRDFCGYKNFCGITKIPANYTSCGGFINGIAKVDTEVNINGLNVNEWEYISKHPNVYNLFFDTNGNLYDYYKVKIHKTDNFGTYINVEGDFISLDQIKK